MALAVSCCSFVGPALAQDSNPMKLRLQVAWGGGPPAVWSGAIKLSSGSFADYRWIGTTARGWPMRLEPQQLVIPPAQANVYEAFEVSIETSQDGMLEIQLSRQDAPHEPYLIKVPLAELITGAFHQALDEGQNRLLVQRIPGDELRVTLDRDHLIFAPGEIWKIDVEPNQLHLPPGSTARFRAQVMDDRTGKVNFRSQDDLTVAEDGTLPRKSGWEITVPTQEGVYELVLTVESQGLAQLFRADALAKRIVQFVVVDSRRPDILRSGEFRKLIEFDAAQPRWWESLMRVPAWSHLPTAAHQVVSDGSARPTQYRGRIVNQLAPGVWQAYPLPITKIGTPHIIEIQCPSDTNQSLVAAVLEPEDSLPGQLQGVAIESRRLPDSRADTLRMVFWPRTRLPYLALHNISKQQPARYESIRLLQGPDGLRTDMVPLVIHGGRQAFAFIASPNYHGVFSPPLPSMTTSGQPLTDWRTFHNGATRLIEYLQYAGYNGATIGVMADGGTLYPAPQLDGSSRFDTGAYFATGQDPLQKDVLELLFRVCDREQMQLMPLIKFSAPLPGLEVAHPESRTASSRRLVDASGRVYQGSAEPATPWFYNPLDPQVQEAVVSTIQHLATRYGHHESFAGVCLELGSDTFVCLPGVEWGLDDVTIRRCLDDSGVDPKLVPTNRDELVQSLITGPLRPVWLAWRGQQMTALYASSSQAVRAVRPEARLVLATSRLSHVPALNSHLAPSLRQRPKLQQVFLEMGLDLAALANHPGLLVTQPFVDLSTTPLTQQAVALELNASDEADRLFRQTGMRAAQLFHRSRRIPFVQPTELARVTSSVEGRVTLMATGAARRAALMHALAVNDVEFLLDGAALANTAASDNLQKQLRLFQHLPAMPFQDVTFANEPKAVRLRQLTGQSETFVYLVNDAPWPVTATVELTAPADCQLRPASDASPAGEWRAIGGSFRWQVKLEPHDVRAGILTTNDVQFRGLDEEFSPDVLAGLQSQLAALVVRVGQLKERVPMNHLANPSFDNPAELTGISGWEVSAETIQPDSAVSRSGDTSLRMSSDGPVVWCRSEAFAPPPSGRLAVDVWLRGHEGQAPPPLRLAVEGRLGNAPYYRYAEITNPNVDAPLDEWSPFELHLDDLPSHELEHLQVRFDLMGAGTAWLDDVSISGLAFTPNEHHELSRIVALADLQLREQRLVDCVRTMSRFWPRFLVEEQIREPMMASQDADALRRAGTPNSGDSSRPRNRIRRVMPRFPRF